MCFSATASFVGGGTILLGSTWAIQKYRFPKRSLLLATIPLIFGLHQLSEGLVWLGIKGSITLPLQQAAMYVYAFIAMCFWPVYIPLAMLVHEYPSKRIPLLATLGVGGMISVYLLWSFTLYSPLNLRVNCGFDGCSAIAYLYELPYLVGIIDYFYVAVVVLPFVLSNNRRIRYGVSAAFLLSFLLALYLQNDKNYPSIWCFLAAVISSSVYYALAPRASRMKYCSSDRVY